jgi:uroporphyrinogen-III synthase
MKVWVTRAEPGAGRTAAKLRDLGHEAVVAPLLRTRSLPVSIELTGVGALAFTSSNGVRAFAALSSDRSLPVFAVGDATADAALKAGFGDVTSADGDVEALAALVANNRDRFTGEVLAPGAKERAGDLRGARLLAVYETVATGAELPAGVDTVLVHSPKAAALLARCDVSALTVLAISEAAARPLANTPLKRLAWAARPDEAALLALLG